MRQLETLRVCNENPRAGKGKIILGKLLEVAGICLALGGGYDFLSGQENSNYLFLLESGGVAFASGYVLDKIGRVQHWYNN